MRTTTSVGGCFPVHRHAKPLARLQLLLFVVRAHIDTPCVSWMPSEAAPQTGDPVRRGSAQCLRRVQPCPNRRHLLLECRREALGDHHHARISHAWW